MGDVIGLNVAVLSGGGRGLLTVAFVVYVAQDTTKQLPYLLQTKLLRYVAKVEMISLMFLIGLIWFNMV